MKKTFTINISGRVFHIDEDAFEKLQRYLDTIKSHFRGFEGRDEIIADIESRISELLFPKITEGRQVVVIADIDEVIGIMGQPSDFAPEEGHEERATPPQEIYVTTKRLYRDPDNKMIGGVSSGIAAYFDIDPLRIRLFFVLFTFTGFGIPLYIILWMVVPQARTTAEKLEMRGEPVNVSNLERSVREEFGSIKDKFGDRTQKGKESYKKKSDQGRDLTRQAGDGVHQVLRVFARIILVFTGIILFIIAVSFTLAFAIAAFGFQDMLFLHDVTVDFFPLSSLVSMIFENDAYVQVFWAGLLILIAIPLLMLLIGSIRLIFNLKRPKTFTAFLGYTWVIVFVVTLMFGIRTLNSFKKAETVEIENTIMVSPGDTLRVLARHINPEGKIYEGEDLFEVGDFMLSETKEGRVIYGRPVFRIRESTGNELLMRKRIRSRGFSQGDAILNAELVSHNVSLSDSSVVIDAYFSLPVDAKWRGQEMTIDLFVPTGCYLLLDRSLYPFRGNIYRYSGHKREDKLLLMTPDGLRDPNKQEVQSEEEISSKTSVLISPISLILCRV